MVYADGATGRWKEIRWIDAVCERWEALYGSLRGDPCRAEAICSLGMKLILEAEVNALPQVGTGGWLRFFSLLTDCPEAARCLCLLGMGVARREVERNEATRSQVRAILLACCPQRRRGNDRDSCDHELIARRRGDRINGRNKSGNLRAKPADAGTLPNAA